MTKNNMCEIREKLNNMLKNHSSFDGINAVLKEAHEEALKDEEYAEQWKAYEEMVESVEPFYNEILEKLKIAEANFTLESEPRDAVSVKFYKTFLSDIKEQLNKNKPDLLDYINQAS